MIPRTLLVVAALFLVGLTTYSFATHRREAPKWDRTRDANILNNHRRYGLQKPVALPNSSAGVAIQENLDLDLHITLDRRGVITIGSAPLSPQQLDGALAKAAESHDGGRVFLWMDKDCPTDTCEVACEILTRRGFDDLYRVLVDPVDPVKYREHRALRLIDSSVCGLMP